MVDDEERHGKGHGPHGPDAGVLFDPDREVVDYHRSAVDLIRLLSFGVAAAIAALATHYLRTGIGGIDADLRSLLDAPVGWLRATVDVLLIATVVSAGLAILIVPLATRRFRLFGYLFVAMAVTGVLFWVIGGWVGLAVVSLDPTPTTEALARTFAADVSATTQLTAAFVTIGPFVGQRWRRLGLITVAAMLVMQLIVVDGEPTHALLILTVGPAVGAAVLLAFGRPITRPRVSSILGVLSRDDLSITALVPTGAGSLGTETYVATLDGGGELFVKVLGTDRLAADQVIRTYRSLRWRDDSDSRAFSSVRRSVEHEALVVFQARDVGVRTARVRSIAPVGSDSFLLAFDRVEGTALGQVPPSLLTDEVLDDLWGQVERLRDHHIAHRRLQPSNLLLDGQGRTWLTGFGRAEVAAATSLLHADVAQLLTVLAMLVGTERSVRSAVSRLGPEAVAGSLGRIQPLALTTTTRSAAAEHEGLLQEIRTEVERQCQVEEAPLEPLARLGARQLLTVVMLVGVVYFLLPQFADLPAILDQLRAANWLWVIPALLASAASYAAATVALIGSTPGRLPVGPTTAAQVGSSFTSTVAPAGLGGMALNVRFLQRSGLDPAVATSSVGLDAVGGVVGHVALIGIFLVWAGRDALGDVELPSPTALLVGVGVVVAIAALTMLLPSTRRLVLDRLVPILGRSVAGLRDVITTPTKVALLLGGSLLITLTYLLAFEFSARAFDIDARFATVGAVFLVGTAIATIAPTPGGLGATEAALIGGLVAVGVGNEQALPAVFLFRLVTFWIPILPGWIAVTWLRRTDRI